MAYSTGGIIENVDYNDIMLNPADAAKRLNSIWGYGKGNRGYGQSGTLIPVQKGEIVTAVQWNEIISRTRAIATRQGNSIAPTIANVAAGTTVNYNNGLIRTDIETIDDTRTWAIAQGSSIYHSRQNLYQWQNQLTYTITCTFASGDQARYFWNCGGQFALFTSQPYTAGKPITQLISDLASAVGTIYWTATPGAGKKTKLSNVDFDAVTKIGGSGTPLVLSKDIDYYNTSLYGASVGVPLLEQRVANTIPAYANSFVRVSARTSGVKGSNSDNGNTIIIQVLFDSVPDGAIMPPLGAVGFYVIPPAPPSNPASGFTSQSWGIPTVTITSSAF